DSCGGDDVVSAGVADLGQGVVFGQNGDGAAVAGAGGRSQSGLDSVQSRVDVDAAGAQHRGDLGDGVVLVVGGFGQGVDGVQQLGQLPLRGLQTVSDHRPAGVGGAGELGGPVGGPVGPRTGLTRHLIEIALIRRGGVTEITEVAHD